jgi:SAM-dependent methyltransferase
MGLRKSLLSGLSKQLGHPSGLRGRVVGSLLNRGNRPAVAGAVDALGLRKGETAADIGFGGGLGLALLLDRVGEQGTVHGVDISETMLARARQRHRTDKRLQTHTGSITELPLTDGSVDAAITVNTIYFVEELDRAFAQVARVLTAGGRFVVGIGAPEGMRKNPVTQHGFRLRPVDEVVAALATAGFSLEKDQTLTARPLTFHLLVARFGDVP